MRALGGVAERFDAMAFRSCAGSVAEWFKAPVLKTGDG